MRTYLTIPKALEQYPITQPKLEQLIAESKLTTFMLEDVDSNQIILYDDELAAYCASQINKDNYNHLRGNLLNLNEAAIKYQISYGTINRWANSGKIDIKQKEKNRTLIDEADIAYIVAVTKMQNMRQGKRLTF